MVVYNHRSFTDIIFSTVIPSNNMVVFLRTWPFRIFLYGKFIKMANYFDLEKDLITDIIKRPVLKDMIAKKASFIFFPEGHRSRDGKLQKFQSGAFLFASEFNLPIVPVCICGTEKVAPLSSMFIYPGKVTVEILQPVYPKDFPDEHKTYKIKKAVENIFLNYLNESITEADKK